MEKGDACFLLKLPNVTPGLPDEEKAVIQKYLHHVHTPVRVHTCTQRASNISCGHDDLAQWWSDGVA